MKKIEDVLSLTNQFDDTQKVIFNKYMGSLPIILFDEDNFNKLYKFAMDNGIMITKSAKGFVRFFSENYDDVVARFDDYKAINYERVVIEHAENIRYDSKVITSRIQKCIQCGKGIEINGEFAPFLFDDIQWKVVASNLNISDVDSEAYERMIVEKAAKAENSGFYMSDVVSSSLVSDNPIDLNPDQFERYLTVSELLHNTRQALWSVNKDDEQATVSSEELISKLIGSNASLSDKEIVIACLKYCNNLNDFSGVNEIIDTLLVSNESEKRSF